MEESRWEKFKKHDKLELISIDEGIVLIIGLFIFIFFQTYRVAFILLVIIWYWFKVRYYERKIIKKESDIYDVYYDNIKPEPQELIDLKTEMDRGPMRYDLKQLENRRKFLVDKFVVLNLILLVLIELFIKK